MASVQERKAAIIRAEGESEAARLISDATKSAGGHMQHNHINKPPGPIIIAHMSHMWVNSIVKKCTACSLALPLLAKGMYRAHTAFLLHLTEFQEGVRRSTSVLFQPHAYWLHTSLLACLLSLLAPHIICMAVSMLMAALLDHRQEL